MGAANNKPLNSGTPHSISSKKPQKKIRKTKIDGFSGHQHEMYGVLGLDNSQNDNFSVRNKSPLHYNEQNVIERLNSNQEYNVAYIDKLPQSPNTVFNPCEISPNSSLIRNTEENTFNRNPSHTTLQLGSGYGNVTSVNRYGENNSWPDSGSFTYSMNHPARTNNDNYSPSFQGQSTPFKLMDFISDRCEGSPDDTSMRTCNSVIGFNTIGNITGAVTKQISDDYGEYFIGSVSNDGIGREDIRNCSNQYDEHRNILNVLKFPSEWSCHTNKTGFVNIPSTSVEGERLIRFFNKTSQTSKFKLYIKEITRIENPFLHTLYLLKKEELRLRNGHVDELHLYHGTKKENISKICEDNFDWRLYSEHRFGMGVSFSPFAWYSSHYCDNSEIKVMLLLKVLVSNSVIGTSDMEIPPLINDVTYDTSIKENTSVVVKYSDNEFYPLYKIIYTKHTF